MIKDEILKEFGDIVDIVDWCDSCIVGDCPGYDNCPKHENKDKDF